jgi:hypothetical protein
VLETGGLALPLVYSVVCCNLLSEHLLDVRAGTGAFWRPLTDLSGQLCPEASHTGEPPAEKAWTDNLNQLFDRSPSAIRGARSVLEKMVQANAHHVRGAKFLQMLSPPPYKSPSQKSEASSKGSPFSIPQSQTSECAWTR